MKTILKLFSVLMLSTIVNASSSWIPITMGDIITFVPSVSISPVENSYPVNATVSVNVNGTLSNNKDWIGIFKKGTQKKWGNQIAWNFVDGESRVALTRNKLAMPVGEYEVALFFNNSSNKVEATATFNVYTKPTLTNYKASYSFGESAWVKIHNKRDTTAHPKDWIGIYPKTSNNDWGNVVEWTWVKDESPAQSGEHDWYEFDGLATGDYEARLFFDNTYHLEAKTAFKVVGDVPHNDYGKPGPYINEVNKIPEEHGDYFVYYPKNHVQGAPLVLVSGHTGVHGYSGLMKYLASKGCYVVGHRDRKDEERGDDKTEFWPDPGFRITLFETALADVINLEVDTSRLITMGSSAGGMVSYKIMEHFKTRGYGATKSFVIDIQGWYVPDMTKNSLANFNSDSLIFQIGGDTSVQGGMSQDPRALLTVSKLLNPNMKKSFIVLPSQNHSYAGGTYDEILNKHDLIDPIDKMLKYEFFNSDGRYSEVENMLFNIDTYNATMHRVYNATMDYIGKGTSADKYGILACLTKTDINYCTDHGLQ